MARVSASLAASFTDLTEKIMSLCRKLALFILTAGVACFSPWAQAQWKPSQDVDLVIPFGLGGGADQFARTLVLVNPQTLITPLKLPGALGIRSLTPLIAAAKAKPRSVSFGSSGTTEDMAINILEFATGAKFNVVRFNGTGEALTALLGGHIDAITANPIELISQLQAKAVRGLGVYRSARFAQLPDLPTLGEQGIKTAPFQMWRGLALPKEAPKEAVAYWEDVFTRVAQTPAFRNYFASIYAAEHVLSSQQFAVILNEQETLYKATLASIDSNQCAS
jgi:tripartite-type tricarboxylate transporter receptor subunit TctC